MADPSSLSDSPQLRDALVTETREAGAGLSDSARQPTVEPAKTSETTDVQPRTLQHPLAADTSKANGDDFKHADAAQRIAVAGEPAYVQPDHSLRSSADASTANGGDPRSGKWQRWSAMGGALAALGAILNAIAAFLLIWFARQESLQAIQRRNEDLQRSDAAARIEDKVLALQQDSVHYYESSSKTLSKLEAEVRELKDTYRGTVTKIAMVEGVSLGGSLLSLKSGSYAVSSFAGCPQLSVKLRGPSNGGNLRVEGGIGGRTFSCPEEPPLPSPIEAGMDRDFLFDLSDCFRSEGITECDGTGWLTVKVIR